MATATQSARRFGVLAVAVIAACTSNDPIDAAVDDAAVDARSRDAVAIDEWPVIGHTCMAGDAPPSVAPPTVDCGPAVVASMGYDPCLHWVECAGVDTSGLAAWAVTFTNGRCETSGHCTFTEPPVFECCPMACVWGGPMGRCGNVGPTAP